MKNLIIFLTAACSIAAVAACSSDNGTPAATDAGGEASSSGASSGGSSGSTSGSTSGSSSGAAEAGGAMCLDSTTCTGGTVCCGTGLMSTARQMGPWSLAQLCSTSA